MNYQRWRKAPSLVDLCVVVAVNNVRYLGDVGETDFHLLDRILPHCTLEQLMHVEDSTQGRDLSSVTNKLWRQFYQRHFGEESANLVVERMKRKKASFRWRELYEAKQKNMAEKEDKLGARIRNLYKKEDDRKHSRQIRLCTKVPPSGSKRNFCGGYNMSNLKSNLMKKAKIDVLKSQEMKNIVAMKRNVVQRNNSIIKPVGSFRGNNSPSSFKNARLLGNSPGNNSASPSSSNNTKSIRCFPGNNSASCSNNSQSIKNVSNDGLPRFTAAASGLNGRSSNNSRSAATTAIQSECSSTIPELTKRINRSQAGGNLLQRS